MAYLAVGGHMRDFLGSTLCHDKCLVTVYIKPKTDGKECMVGTNSQESRLL